MATRDIVPSAETEDVGEGKVVSSELGTFEKVKRWYKESRDGTSKWRTNVRKYYAFKSGDQWEAADAAKLKENGRPCITYNRIEPIVAAVAGVEIQNRQTIRYIPRTQEDGPVNEIITGASDFFRDEASSNEEESDAFEDMLICGLGWTETRMEYTEDQDGKMCDNRIDPLEMYQDPTSQKRNLADSRFVIRVKDFDYYDACQMFPHIKDEDDLHAEWANDIEDTKASSVDRQARAKYESPGRGKTQKRAKVRIVECQWCEYEPVYTFVNPTTGELERLDEATFAKLKRKLTRAAKEEIAATEQRVKVYKRAFCGAKLLNRLGEDGKPDLTPPCEADFTYQAMTGKRDRNEREWYGIVKPMMDPQRWANGFMSAILHIIQTSGKGMMLEETAVTDVRDFEQKFAKPDAIKWLAPNAVKEGKIFPIPNQSLPAGLPDMMVHAISAIRDVTGVNLELLGLADRQQAGVLEQQRKQAGLTILAGLYDSLRQFRKRKGRVVLWYIENRLSDGRLIRIVGPEGAKYIPLLRQEGTTRYDVIVDDTPSSPNSKEMVWQTVMGMGPVLQQAGLPPQVWAGLVRYSPLPSSVSEPIAQAMLQPKGPPPEVAIQQQKFELEKQKMEMESQLKQQQAQFDMEIEKARLELDIQKAQVEMQMESQKAEQQMQIKRQEAVVDAELAQHKANTDMEISREKMQGDQQIKRETARAQAQPQPQIFVGSDGKATQISDTTQQLAEVFTAFVERQQERDAQQDARFEMLAKAMTADTEIMRDESGRAIGARRRMMQ